MTICYYLVHVTNRVALRGRDRKLLPSLPLLDEETRAGQERLSRGCGVLPNSILSKAGR